MAFWRRFGSWFGGNAEKPADETAPVRQTARELEPQAGSIAPKTAWPAILGKTLDHPDGGLAQAVPIANVRIQGVPCSAGSRVSFARNGRLTFAVLADTHALEGETLPPGAWVLFENDGTLRGWKQKLATDREFRVRAADSEEVALPVTIPAGSEVYFEWGKLREVVLARAVAFDGHEFPAGTELIFGDSGALSHVTCSEEIELRGVRWLRGKTVVFEFGRLHEGYPAGDGTYDGVPYQFGEIVRLHENGRLARCYLAADALVSGVPCAEGERIYLDDEGHLVEATLAEDCVLAGIPVAEGDEIGLENGKPTVLKPREDCDVEGIPCARDKLVELTTEGRLVRATLSRAHAIDSWNLPAGSTIVLDAGKLRQAVVTDAMAPDGRDLRGMWRVFRDDDGATRHVLPVNTDRLAGISLREDATIDGFTAAAGTSVDLASDGSVRSLVLAADQRVGPWTAKAGTRVHFHDNRTPSNINLVEDTRISNVPCAGARTLGAVMNGVEHSYREEVRLHPNGSLSWAKLAESTTVASIPLERSETIALYENGTVQVGTLAGRWQHSLGCVARKCTLLGLFEDGSPSLLTLDAPFALDGTEYPAGSVLRFTSPGVVASVDSVRVSLGPCDPLPISDQATSLEDEART